LDNYEPAQKKEWDIAYTRYRDATARAGIR
jgi:hypothetical protein